MSQTITAIQAPAQESTGALSRAAVFAYGAMAYVAFAVAIGYAIGFFTNFGVPKSIDSGAPGPLSAALMINVGLLTIFAVQHSGMARKGFKQWLTRTVPQAMERSTYVLMSSLALLFMFWQWQPMPQVVWQVDSALGAGLIYVVAALGWTTVVVATLNINHFDLFGVRQVWTNLKGEEYQDLGFRVIGLYQFVRHPIQVGFLIAFWATPTMTVGHLYCAVIVTAYIFLAVKKLEERDLVREMGGKYRNYMSQVSGFLPLSKYREPAA